MSSPKTSSRFRFTGAALLLTVLIFLVPALRNGDPSLYLLAVLVPCALFLCCTVLARMFSLDRILLVLSLYLCAVGIAALAHADPRAALAQALRCGIALVALLAGGILVRSLSPSLLTSGCAAFLGLLLLSANLLSSSLKQQMTGPALVLLLVAFASLFARQGSVPAALLGCVSLALLLIAGETGFALLWGLAVLLLLFAADGRAVVFLPSLAAVILLCFGAFRLFPVQAQPSSFLDALSVSGAVGSDSLPEAVASLGTVPLFLRVTGHFGLIFTGLTLLLYLPLSLRGAFVAASSRSRFHAILGMGAVLLIALRTLAAALSAFGFSPVPVPDFPFLVLSLPDLCAQLFLVGLLCGISGRNDADLAEDAHLAMLAK